MPKRKFSDEEEKKICVEYFSEEKPSTITLAEKFNCDRATIGNIIIRTGYKLRTRSEACKGKKAWNKKFTEKEEQQICDEYLNKKISSITLAKKYGCTDATIGHIVKRNGYKVRSLSNALKGRIPWIKGHTKETDMRLICSEETKRKISKFTTEEEQQICNEYFSEENPSTIILAKKWNCSWATIDNILKRNGYKLRTNSESHSGKNHPLYGTHRSDITKQKISKAGKGKTAWNKNQQMSKESKEKMSKSALFRIQNNLGPFKDTKPELKMKEILNELNVIFEHQFRVGNHNFDFHILNTNILIEVDGDYWHGNPKKFSNLHERQIKQRERDLKNEQLADKNGFTIIRFWEDDILNNIDIVKTELRKILYEKNYLN